MSSNSPKKQRNEFIVVVQTNLFVRFFGRIQGYQKSFWKYLTFRKESLKWKLVVGKILKFPLQTVRKINSIEEYTKFIVLIIWMISHVKIFILKLQKYILNQFIVPDIYSISNFWPKLASIKRNCYILAKYLIQKPDCNSLITYLFRISSVNIY